MRDVNANCHTLVMGLSADNTEHQRVPHRHMATKTRMRAVMLPASPPTLTHLSRLACGIPTRTLGSGEIIMMVEELMMLEFKATTFVKQKNRPIQLTPSRVLVM